MSDYGKLVEALRYCMAKEDGITICEPCPYYGKGIECENVLHTDAADAIEELEAENKQFRKGIAITARDKLRVEEKVKVLQAEVDALYRIMIRGQMEVQDADK